ncbi:hypothetical protein MYAM1_001465 [Malassezia yamatoensis]|uniref:Uncharacterized protein n=1 Tax=Malassezia yamatoensis TaxID=253288 RepID=A0AAJ5YQG6_9BASI|nr:hypothetical protein MYAM1_001465 [Malassezia yamatoensis]
MSTGLGVDIAVHPRAAAERARIRRSGSYKVWVPSPPRPLSDGEEEDSQIHTCRETSTSASHASHRHRHRRRHESRSYHKRRGSSDARARSPESKLRTNDPNEHHAWNDRDHEMLSPENPSRLSLDDSDEEYGPMPEEQLDQDYKNTAMNEASNRRSKRVSTMDERRLHLRQQAEQRAQREARVIAQFREMVDSMQEAHHRTS